MIEVGEDHLLLHTLYNWGSNVTLVLREAACMAALQQIRQPKRRINLAINLIYGFSSISILHEHDALF